MEKKKVTRRGVDQRMEALKIIESRIKVKEKEYRRINASVENNKRVIENQQKIISDNKEKGNSLDVGLGAKVNTNKKELEILDKLFIKRKTKLENDLLPLETRKKELESGENNIKKNIEQIKKDEKIARNDLMEINKKLVFGETSLKILNQSIINNKTMSKESKKEKELILNDVASLKIEQRNLKKENKEISEKQKSEQARLDRIMKKADYLVRFEDHLRGQEEQIKEWCKRLGIVYQNFQQ